MSQGRNYLDQMPRLSEFYGIAIYMYSAITTRRTSTRSTPSTKLSSESTTDHCCVASSLEQQHTSLINGASFTKTSC